MNVAQSKRSQIVYMFSNYPPPKKKKPKKKPKKKKKKKPPPQKKKQKNQQTNITKIQIWKLKYMQQKGETTTPTDIS